MENFIDIFIMNLNSLFNGELKSFISKTGLNLKIKSKRFYVYKNSNFTCASCGIKITHIKIQKDSNHKENEACIRFYNISDSKHTLFTIDHIIPRAKGGRNNLENLQAMCSPCNHKKDSKLDSLTINSKNNLEDNNSEDNNVFFNTKGLFPKTLTFNNSSVISYKITGVEKNNQIYWFVAAFYNNDIEVFCDKNMNIARNYVERIIRKKHNIKQY